MNTAAPASLLDGLDRLGDELAMVAVTANFSTKLTCESTDAVMQKLVMMVNVLLDTVAGTLAELQHKNDQLTAMRGLERTVEDQREVIAVLSTPVIEVWKGVVGVPIVGHLDAARADQLAEALLVSVRQKSAAHVIIDLTGVADFDAVAVQSLAGVVRAVRLLGARVYVVGTSPKLATTLVSMDFRLDGALMMRSMATALRHCLEDRAPGAVQVR